MAWGSFRNVPCPCGSANKAKKCCWTANGWKKKPLGRLTEPGEGEVGHQRCYARALGGCSDRISGEHYFSRTILQDFSSIRVSGPKWIREGETRQVGLSSLVAKILCQHHNSCLGSLDSEGGRFFAALRDFDAGLHDHPLHSASEAIFAGEDIERWLLKCLCGLLASGSLRTSLHELPYHWMELLFLGTQWPDDAGLYFTFREGRRFHASQSLESSLLLDETGSVRGLTLFVAGFGFSLVLAKPNWAASSAFDGGVYRPRGLRLRRLRAVKTLHMTWSTKVAGDWVDLDRVGSYRGLGPSAFEGWDKS